MFVCCICLGQHCTRGHKHIHSHALHSTLHFPVKSRLAKLTRSPARCTFISSSLTRNIRARKYLNFQFRPRIVMFVSCLLIWERIYLDYFIVTAPYTFPQPLRTHTHINYKHISDLSLLVGNAQFAHESKSRSRCVRIASVWRIGGGAVDTQCIASSGKRGNNLCIIITYI